jgi:pre-mRNA-splicing factor SYF1
MTSARKILEKGTKVNFKAVEDLAEVWCEWAEMELRHEYVRVYSRENGFTDD